MLSIRTITKFLGKWNIEVFIMLSLLLQIILLLLTPFRKRSRNQIIRGSIWLAYIVADWAAPYAIGLISSHESNSPKHDDVRVDIRAFWAVFLFLHLSGPDNASAFSIEDNSLWRRHLTGLIGQLLSTVIVFSQKLPRNKLWICTILLFVAGTIKNAERASALCLANANFNPYRAFLIKGLRGLDPSCLPTKKGKLCNIEVVKCACVFEEKRLCNVEMVKCACDFEEKKLPNVEVVRCACTFTEILGSLVMGVKPKSKARKRSRCLFINKDHTEALRVLEVELNLLYDVFYTKLRVVYSKLGCVFRYLYWCAVVVALLIFSSIDKHGFRSIDVHISYTLLVGTIALDAIALFMFAASEWVVIHIDKFLKDAKGSWRHSLYKCFLSLLECFFSLKTIKWGSEKPKFCYFDWVIKLLFGFFYWVKEILFSRWSRSLRTHNLINYCLKERHKKNHNGNGFLKDFYVSIKYVSKEPIEEKLWELIFTQLQEKAKKLEKKAKGCRGGKHSCVGHSSYAYHHLNNENEKLSSHDFGKYQHSCVGPSSYSYTYLNNENEKLSSHDIGKYHGHTSLNNKDEKLSSNDFGKYHSHIVLILHIATDLCYEKKEDDNSYKCYRKNSKVLSNYMLYLQVMKPALMFAASGTVKVRFHDTCKHAKRLFREMKSQKIEHAKVREEWLKLDAMKIKPMCNEKESVLPKAITLVKKLEELCPLKRWKLISELWVELLSHAGGRCKADVHIAQLSKGGELITFVWLLKAHFGLRDHFQPYKGIESIVDKYAKCSIIRI